MKYWSIVILLIIISCSKKSVNGNLPSVFPNSLSQSRADTNSTFRFYVTLSTAAAKQISIQYTTADGTAFANKDYIPASGTITISPGETQQYVDVTVIGD